MPVLSRRRILQSTLATGLLGCGRTKDRPSQRDTGLGLSGTPREDGFWMPDENATHAGCLMQLPPPDHYCLTGSSCALIEAARGEWAQVALAIAEYERVRMYVEASDMAWAQDTFGSAVELVEAELDDGWSRDSGPVLLRNAEGVIRAACFEFNGWGRSFSYAEDALVKWQMAADLGVDTYDHPMILEGGAVIVDGAGTLITTEECLLHSTRNPDLSQDAQEQILKDYLGVDTVIWLENGWTPDPLTNGHVDGIAAFVKPGVVMLNSIAQSEDPTNYAILESARARLEAAGMETIRLPATSWTAFHINFYVANGAVVVPIEGRDAVDDTPLGTIRDAFPSHTVVGVTATTLGQAGGGIHCITQQVPDGVW